MVMLFKFLWRNLKGYRLLFVLTIIITVSQVGSDIVAALPLKFIPSKVVNVDADPACDFPFLDPVLGLFDKQFPDHSSDKAVKCPESDQKTEHSTTGVIIFSVLMLVIFGGLSAVLTY